MIIIDFLVGLSTGIISGFGIGGGSLLILYLTAFADVQQKEAGGINLLYFIGCASSALVGHIRNKNIDRKAVIGCVSAGAITAVVSSLCFKELNTNLLQRLFGIVLLYVGFKEIFYKNTTNK